MYRFLPHQIRKIPILAMDATFVACGTVDVLNPSITTTELFDLLVDPFERNDLSGQYPEIVAELEMLMQNA
jgi:hypothetical protein